MMRDAPRDAFLPAVLAGLAIVAVVAGLVIVGGPGRGKAEQRDAERISNLRDASRLVACLARQNDMVIPEELLAQAACGPLDGLRDPFSGSAIQFEKLGDRLYLLCTELELASDYEDDKTFAGGRLRADSGCIRYEYHP